MNLRSTASLFTKYLRSSVIEIDKVCFFIGCAVLVGKTMSKALVVTKVDVNIKKISNKKTMSVIDDMLKLGFILFCECNDISYFFYHILNLKTL